MPFTVAVAEKPSVAKDIAHFLAGKGGGRPRFVDSEGYWLPNGDLVTYPVGHIIEMEMPDVYLKAEQQNADPLTYLPILPEKYAYRPRSQRNKDGSPSMRDGKPVVDPLFKSLDKYLKKADVILNCGDIGREGQLIMDELFLFCGIDPDSPRIKRVAIVDMNPKGIEAAFNKITQNSDPRWRNSRMAGQARQEADWEVGINASRAYWSLVGSRRVALGRIKTPVLAMVDDRCREIENFKPEQYYVPVVTMKDGLELRWKARLGAAGTPGFDKHGRITSKELADDIVARINAGLQGTVNDSRREARRVAPPKPFSLATLQSTASKRLGLTVEEVTKAAQTLYEKHKMISYVGTECQYLPESMLDEARGIMANLSPMFEKVMCGANPALRPASFDDSKLDEHYAIMPTGVMASSMDPNEKAVFEVISRRFAAQFYDHYEYNAFALGMQFGNDQFAANGQETVKLGWKEAEGVVDKEAPDEEGGGTAPRDLEIDSPGDSERA